MLLFWCPYMANVSVQCNTVGFSPILYSWPYVTPLGNPFNTMMSFCPYSQCALLNLLMGGLDAFKNLNACRPSEHPPVREKNLKRLGGIIGCKDKTSSWHLNEFRDGTCSSNIGSTVSCRGETLRYAVHLLHQCPMQGHQTKEIQFST